MNTATLKIAINVDDKGSVKIRDLGNEATNAGAKGEKSFAGMRGQIDKLKGSTDLTLGSIGQLASMGFAAGIAGLAALSAGMVATLGAASNLQETQSKFDVVFAGQKGQAEAWAKELVNSYGMSTRESKQYLSSVQDLLVPMGMMPDAAARMSSEVVKLSADLGSFNDLPTAQVMDDIQSALVGEYDTMKKYGVVLNAATVEQRAMTMGLAETTDELTAGDKAQAAYAMMVEASSAAIGDMARTSDGYANQMKSFHAITEDLTAAMGQKLLPIAADVLGKINNGMRDGKGGVEGLATMITTKLLQALGMAVETMRFFHNGWLGIKLVGTAAIDAIAQSMEFLFGGIRQLLTPLDLVFDGLIKIGAIDVNPFDGVEAALGTFSASSRDVTNQVLDDIDKTNAGYDKIKTTIDGYIDQVQKSAKEESIAAKKIQDEHIDTGSVMVKTTDKTVKAAQGANDTQQRLAADLTVKAKQEAAAQEKLSDDLTRKIKEQTLSRYDYEVWVLSEEVAAMRLTAGSKKEIIDNITLYEKTSLDALKEKHGIISGEIAATYSTLQLAVTGSDGSATKLWSDFGDGLDGIKSKSADTLTGSAGMSWQFGQMADDAAGEGVFLAGEINDSLTGMRDASKKYVLDDDNSLLGHWIEFGDEASGQFGNFAGDIASGNKTIGDAWDDLWKSMLGTMVTAVGKMVGEYATMKVAEFAVDALFSHDGTVDVKNDEQHTIIQKGQMIVPRDDSALIRENLSNSDSTFDDLVQASYMYAAASDRNGGDIGGFGPNAAGGYTGMFGMEDGIKGLANIGAKAAIRGYLGVDQNPERDVAGFGIGEVADAIGAAMDAMASIDPSAYSNLGHSFMEKAGFAFGGPMAGVVGNAFGGIVGDLVGDMLNDRDFEGVRDAYEDGTITQQEKSQFKAESQRMGFDDPGHLGSFTDKLGEIGRMAADAFGITAAVNAVSNMAKDMAATMGLRDRDSQGYDSQGYDSRGYSNYGGGVGGGPNGGSDPGGDQGHGARGGGDEGNSEPGGIGGYASGGLVNRLYVPHGDDGYAPVSFGEGVLSRTGMKNLDKLNSGELGNSADGLNSAEVGAILWQIASATKKAAAILERFEFTGIPQSTREAIA